METIKYGGELVHFKKMICEVNYRHCVLCNKSIAKGDEIYLVTTSVTHGKGPLFPNVIIHKDCTHPTPPFDTNNHLVWTAGELRKTYQTALKYRYWFDE